VGDAGGLAASLDSPDQNATNLPVETIAREGDVVRFASPKLGLSYEGRLDAAGKTLAGTLKQGPASMPLTLAKVDHIAVAARPQEPKPPFPYVAEEVTVRNEAAGVTLAGTFTRPRGDGRFPA